MNRQIAVIAATVLAAIVVAGAVVISSGDGATALTIDGRTSSQQTLDDELRVLAAHPTFIAGLIQQQAVAPLGESLPASASAGWLTLRVITDVAAQELARRDEPVTADDRDATGLDGAPPFEELPRSFRDTVKDRLGAFRALQRVLTEENPERISAAARESCASGRYVSHILVATLPEAQSAKSELDGGGDFADLARTVSIDTGSADAGGQLGCLADGAFVEPFQTVALTQAPGVVSDPVQTEFGFHLILVTDEPPAGELEAAAIQEILGTVRDTPVEVDPRYGRWDARNGQVIPPQTPGT